jgi:hypothetical protein
MMKLATLAAIAGSAAAFAPAQQGRVSTAVQGFENELGVIAPTGFFDPLGLSKVSTYSFCVPCLFDLIRILSPLHQPLMSHATEYLTRKVR